ncbi:hypothetical protein [Crocinitomix catalasitica]|uniref:hypothetical protein n=1 Tax=Crocinitomix catalasitica TaxID=184607 RepID=UPI0004864F1C|nr:hypothetical protein [Crocinitomix catalasitica]
MIDTLEIVNRLVHITDNGPMYNEFIHDAYIHEPWNAFSSLIFFIPIIYWIWKLHGNYANHKIIVLLLPLLFLNGLGSTLFHSFRNEPAYFILDWLPASLMSFCLACYFWYKVVDNIKRAIILTIAFQCVAVLSTNFLSQIDSLEGFGPNIGYFFVGTSLLIPIIIFLFKTKFKFVNYIILSFIFLSTALICRMLDYPTPNPFPELLPQGTHFLWHIFSSFAVFSMGYYIFKLNNWLRKIEE